VVSTPGIVVTKTCPPRATPQGGTLTFTATVANTGNTTLTNIVVVNSMPAPNTVVFRAAALAPGAVTNFTGSYLVPGNCCSVTDTLLATGSDICNGIQVSDTATAICPVLFTPRVSITKNCPTTAPAVGEPLVYTGTISNSGNVTIEGVIVYNSVSGMGNPVLGIAALAPGESATYISEYDLPADFCGRDTVTVQAVSICGGTVTDSVTSTCPVLTAPALAITRSCPGIPIPRGGTASFTAQVINTGNVTLTNVVVRNTLPNNPTPIFGPVTLAPGQSANVAWSYTTPTDCNCCEVVDTIAASGAGLCDGRQVAATSTVVCEYASNPGVAVTLQCPTSTPNGLLKYTGVVANTGDCTLTNVIVVANVGGGKRLVGPITLAVGESQAFSDSFTVGEGTPTLSTLTVAAQGTGACTGVQVSDTKNCSGSVVGLVPKVETPRVSATGVVLSWTSTPGLTYRVQSSSSPSSVSWVDEPGDVTATGAHATKTLASPGTAQRFYRVMVVR
jgi:uncharacterized repeat protein (TIGR01451 family)